MDSEFDESKAIEAINAALTAAGRSPYADDQVLNIIDMIWDFYEENGLLEIDADDNDDPEDIEPDLVEYVSRMVRRDKASTVASEDIPLMVKAELAYEDTVI